MSVVVVLQQDPFDAKFKGRIGKARKLAQRGYPRDFSHVRRPFRGIAVKEDTWATLEVFDGDGAPIPLLDSGSRLSFEQIAVLENFMGFRPKVGGMDEQSREQQYGDGYDRKGVPLPDIKQRSEWSAYDTQVDYINSSDFAGRTKDVEAANVVGGIDADYQELVSDYSASKLDALARQSRDTEIQERFRKFSSGGYSLRYSNFVLNGATEMRQEKFQIVETFGNPYIFFYGEKPRIYQFSGILVNSLDFQWRAEWWANYDEVFRGTKLVERNARVVISWDDVVAEGYILQAQAAETSDQPYLIQFNFQMFVTNYTTMAPVGDPKFPRPLAVSIDKSMWVDAATLKQVSSRGLNEDVMRRANMQPTQNVDSTSLGFKTFVRNISNAMTTVSEGASLVDEFVSSYRKYLQSVTYTLGGNPVVEELRQREDLRQYLETRNPLLPVEFDGETATFLAEQISTSTRRLVEAGLDDAAGLPEIVVQDKDLIINLTRQYNRTAFRRIKILSPRSPWVKPADQEKAYAGFYRDNSDEYVQSVLVSAVPKKMDFKDQLSEEEKAQHLDEVLAQMITKLRESGIPLTEADAKRAEADLFLTEEIIRMDILPIEEKITGPVGQQRADRPDAETIAKHEELYTTNLSADPTPQRPKAQLSNDTVVSTKQLTNKRVLVKKQGNALHMQSQSELEQLLQTKRRSLKSA